jgi:hypothetical protein
MKHLILVSAILSLSFLLSCKDDDDPEPASRAISYEVSGNFSGSLFASYTTASGGTSNESIAALPWSKEITYESSVDAANIAISGNSGVAGQQVTIVVKSGGTQLSSTTATADASGSFTKAAPVVTF